jgi:hypothetical protein
VKNGVFVLAGLLGLTTAFAAYGTAFGPVLAPSIAEEDDAPPPGGMPMPLDAPEDDEPEDEGPKGPPLTPEELKAASELLQAGRDLQGRHQYGAARKRFRELLEAYPGAPSEMRTEAEDRSEENCFLGFEEIRHGGRSPNRIDVELMGDGYLLAKQEQFKKHADAQIGDFYRDPLYDEYESYFNVWRFDLASKEEGVDEVGREPPPDESRPPKKPRRKRKLKEFSTALDCKAAGPQNQVWANPLMVRRWRKYLPVSDGLTIAFAKKGQLGMGGMGIATTGRRVAVVHEFGHAFVGLLDEYAVNPEAPRGPAFLTAANAVPGKGPKEPPDPENVPWKHWLDAKNREVGVFLGGATYQLGVFRPATDCAMNSGGGSPYCWVCREAGVLRIYEYVSPVDASAPDGATVEMGEAETREFSVTPMVPKRHRLSVTWYLERLTEFTGEGATTEGSAEERKDPETDAIAPDEERRGAWRRANGPRFRPGPPPGKKLDAVERKGDGGARSCVDLSALPKGRHRLTAVVVDDANLPGQKFPWVLKDPDRLLEERRIWTIDVGPPKPKPLKPPRRGSD